MHTKRTPRNDKNNQIVFQFPEANSITMGEKLENSEKVQAELLAAAMARGMLV